MDITEHPNLHTVWMAQKFIADHPDLPPVQQLNMRHHIHGGTVDDRMAQLEQLAAQYGVKIWRRDRAAWVELPIAVEQSNGALVTFTVQTHTDDEQRV
jgi:hypothetical protein